MFLVAAKKIRTFSSFPYSTNEQVCRSWEGAEPGSQPKLARGNIPYHRCHAQFMNGGWPGGRNPFICFLFSLFSMSLKFSRSSAFFGSFAKFVKSMSSTFCSCCLGTGCELVTEWWENYTVYSLHCKFIISSIISVSISISFVTLLNCLYLNPRVSPFFHFSFPSCWEGARGGVSERLPSA